MEYVPACSSFFFEMAAGSRKVLQPAPVTFFFRDRAFGWNIRECSEQEVLTPDTPFLPPFDPGACAT